MSLVERLENLPFVSCWKGEKSLYLTTAGDILIRGLLRLIEDCSKIKEQVISILHKKYASQKEM